ncbi:MAG TPA: class I SAM-dependent methyltransferase [Pseudonocardia sp.]|jgi:predicted O-methyltransferase YrrM
MANALRDKLRAKVTRAVDEVVSRHRAEQEQVFRDELDRLRADLRRETERVLEFARSVELRDRRDLFAAGERTAVAEAAAFAQAEMATARSFPNPIATLEYALTLVGGEGMALEFGVFTGTTLKVIASACPEREVYGFDSFDGLPEDWRLGFTAGAFHAEPPEVPGAELVVGLFSDTLPGFLREHPGPVALLHLDADLYSSTRTVLDLVGPRLRPGSVVVFDEYFNYPGWAEHEHRAWREFVDSSGVDFRYEAYTFDNEQVVVRITGV